MPINVDPYLALRAALRSGGAARLIRNRAESGVAVNPWRALRPPLAASPSVSATRRLKLTLLDGSNGELVVQEHQFTDGLFSVSSIWVDAYGNPSRPQLAMLPLHGSQDGAANRLVLCEAVPAVEPLRTLGLVAVGRFRSVRTTVA